MNLTRESEAVNDEKMVRIVEEVLWNNLEVIDEEYQEDEVEDPSKGQEMNMLPSEFEAQPLV